MAKGKHKFVDSDNVSYNLDVVQNYSLPTEYRIVINESATGSSGVSYFNGRSFISIPITGRLFGTDIDDINNQANTLLSIGDAGKVIEFIGPYKPIASNKFFIKNLTFEASPGAPNSIGFSCTLIEFRQANVKTTAVNLVNFAAKQAFLDVYNSRIGNLESN